VTTKGAKERLSGRVPRRCRIRLAGRREYAPPCGRLLLKRKGIDMAVKKKPVLILDSHRGIYFGYLASRTSEGKTVRLTRARHCFYFVAKQQDGESGVYSLATAGPQSGSKIGPRVTMTVNDVTKIIDCSSEAVERWESATWG